MSAYPEKIGVLDQLNQSEICADTFSCSVTTSLWDSFSNMQNVPTVAPYCTHSDSPLFIGVLKISFLVFFLSQVTYHIFALYKLYSFYMRYFIS